MKTFRVSTQEQYSVEWLVMSHLPPTLSKSVFMDHSSIWLTPWAEFFLIYFNWRLITLQYYGFCHTFTWISHGCTCVPHPDPPSHLPPHPIPQGHPSAPALSTLSHASNLDWWSISHMIYVINVKTLYDT